LRSVDRNGRAGDQYLLHRTSQNLAQGGDDPGRLWRRLSGVLQAWPVVSTANRVSYPPASAIEATSSMPVAKVGGGN
jgi:hypothetical protein